MPETEINYYILFETYTDGMLLHDLLKRDGIPSRIAPAPRSIQGELGCGVSLLVLPADIEAARAAIGRHQAPYVRIVPLPCQINPNRYRFC